MKKQGTKKRDKLIQEWKIKYWEQIIEKILEDPKNLTSKNSYLNS